MGSFNTTTPSLPDLPIIWREDAPPGQYEEARVGRVFNHRRPSRYPRAVVQATSEQHVVDAMKLANTLGCRVSVRSGGHSWAAWSVRDDAILIDLGQYHHLVLQEDDRIVEASPSTTGRVLNGMLADKGYMFAGGHCPEVGIGGFLLQGGMGWNCKNWGWACEKVRAVDVVTATGSLLHCTAEKNSELFWMARGAGPGFPGIVTKFYLEIRQKYNGMLCSFVAYPLSKYREVMDWVVRISPQLDESVEVVAVSQTLPGETEHSICAVFVSFKDLVEEARVALEPVKSSCPGGWKVQALDHHTDLADQYKNQAAANPEGHRYCTENAYISNDADVTTVMEAAFTTLPHPKAFALYFAMNPCSRRELPDMALSMQTDHYFALYTVWEDDTDDLRCRGWVRDIMSEVELNSEGAYLGDSDFQVRRTRFWEDANARKLMRLRQKWDPEGRICGYLDVGDQSGTDGLANLHEWKAVEKL
ncbi:hypothetical protein LTR08_009160 [Meristemomyces frigidus]|nr:hypothetical protein LTR08_009160 [Meristemomyces frigidus]